MALEDIADKAGANIVTYAIISGLGFCGLLVRRIFTNQALIASNQAANEASIKELRSEIQSREALRQQDREHYGDKIDDLKVVINETQADVKKLFQKR